MKALSSLSCLCLLCGLSSTAQAEKAFQGWTGDSAFYVIRESSNGADYTSVVKTVVDVRTGESKDYVVEDSESVMRCYQYSGEGGESASAGCLAGQEARKKAASESDKAFDDFMGSRAGGTSAQDAESPPQTAAEAEICPDAGAKSPCEPGQRLLILIGGAKRFSARMPASEKKPEANWSPDGQRIVWQAGETIVLGLGVPKIDLLDAGAGAKSVEMLARKLTAAGYSPAHRGKAGSPHPQTELFFAAGFEADAAAIAKALGLPTAAVRPLTWGSKFAITIAAGS